MLTIADGNGGFGVTYDGGVGEDNVQIIILQAVAVGEHALL